MLSILFIFPFLITSSFAFICQDKIYSNDGFLHGVLLDVLQPNNIKSSFDWKRKCTEPIQSEYLPLRPGLTVSGGQHNFDVIRLKQNNTFKLKNFLNSPSQFASLLFYVLSKGGNELKVVVITFKEIFVDLNHEVTKIARNETYYECRLWDAYGFCIWNWWYPSFRHGRNVIIFKIKSGWNLVHERNIRDKQWYKFSLEHSGTLKHTPFIPWHTSLPKRCTFTNEWIKKNFLFVKSIDIEMNFTYGQEYGLGQLETCLHNMFAREIHPHFHFHLKFGHTYDKAVLQMTGEDRTKREFLLSLNDRKKSGICLEYTCLFYRVITPTITFEELNDDFTDSEKLFSHFKNNGPTKVIPKDIIREITDVRSGKKDFPVCPGRIHPAPGQSVAFFSVIMNRDLKHNDDFRHIRRCLVSVLNIQSSRIKIVTGRIGTKIAVILPTPGDSLREITYHPISKCYRRIHTTCYTNDADLHGDDQNHHYNVRIHHRVWFYPVLITGILLFLVAAFVIYNRTSNSFTSYNDDEDLEELTQYRPDESITRRNIKISKGIMGSELADLKGSFNSHYNNPKL